MRCMTLVEVQMINRIVGTVAFVAASVVMAAPSARADAAPIYMDQGSGWTSALRQAFYTQDQGAEMIPFAWLQALKQPGSDKPFLDGALDRYGYLPLENNNGLPVGFTTRTGADKSTIVGMNCSACHTREITVSGQNYRIDGGPAIVDFQSLLNDLDLSMKAVRASDASFQAFAVAVLGTPNPKPADVKTLRAAVDLWFVRFDTLVQHALPKPSWGPGRLDAVSMIFNRVTGLDIGPAPSHVIADNIKSADAPVRYPFLWNAAIQDFTQWPGFAKNGNDILGLARNLGEVYGVFGVYQPKKVWPFPVIIDFLNNNSANFQGLLKLEDMIKKIGAPKYAWPIDAQKAELGAKIYQRSTKDGGCAECHAIRPGEIRFPDVKTWATPLMDVGTDSREWAILGRTAQTGVLNGFGIPGTKYVMKKVEKSFDILSVSVVGSIGQEALRAAAFLHELLHDGAPTASNGWSWSALSTRFKNLKGYADLQLPKELSELNSAFRGSVQDSADKQAIETYKTFGASPSVKAAATEYKYESRVMEGIWAAAPYLHDGSVPTLADLLEPVEKRPTSFVIGPNYDIKKLGIAQDQTKFTEVLHTGCSDGSGGPTSRDSGNSNCGHAYGVNLKPEEKEQLLEYLKGL